MIHWIPIGVQIYDCGEFWTFSSHFNDYRLVSRRSLLIHFKYISYFINVLLIVIFCAFSGHFNTYSKSLFVLVKMILGAVTFIHIIKSTR